MAAVLLDCVRTRSSCTNNIGCKEAGSATAWEGRAKGYFSHHKCNLLTFKGNIIILVKIKALILKNSESREA